MIDNNDLDFDALDDEEIIIPKLELTVPKEVVAKAQQVDEEPEDEDDSCEDCEDEDSSDDEVDLNDLELNEEDIKAVEAKAVADAPDLTDIDTFINDGKTPVKAAIKATTKTATTKTPVAPKVVWKGPRVVKVYGDEIYTEAVDTVTLEEIRQKLVDTYKFAEYSKDRTYMSIDELTGIVVPTIRFEKKG